MPSKITKISSTLIDENLTNNITYKHTSGLICRYLSDHLPIITLCKDDGLKLPIKTTIYIRKINDKAITCLSNKQKDDNGSE